MDPGQDFNHTGRPLVGRLLHRYHTPLGRGAPDVVVQLGAGVPDVPVRELVFDAAEVEDDDAAEIFQFVKTYVAAEFTHVLLWHFLRAGGVCPSFKSERMSIRIATTSLLHRLRCPLAGIPACH